MAGLPLTTKIAIANFSPIPMRGFSHVAHLEQSLSTGCSSIRPLKTLASQVSLGHKYSYEGNGAF